MINNFLPRRGIHMREECVERNNMRIDYIYIGTTE